MHDDLDHTLEAGGAGTAVLLDEPDSQALAPVSSGHSGTFQVRNPGTGEVVGTYPVATAVEVQAAVGRAREAAEWWSTLGFAERGRRLDAFRGILARRIHELAALMREEMGKPHSDAALEVAVVLDHIAWAAKHAEKTLSPRRTRSGLATIHLKGRVGYQPLGVIGVIGPWNFPVMTPLGSVIFALAAGNTVVFKPSEFSPGVGLWLERAMAEVVPEQPVFQVVTGTGATGAALSRAGVDKVSFTGSTATAKKVMAACAESLTPLVAECGGKDAVIIDRDADLDAAVDGVTWSAFANAGQACIGTERVYVHQDRYEDFLARLVDRVGPLQAGPGDEKQIGAITMPSQVGVIEAHVRDALDRGGRVLVGG
ncbi:MAG: aldehyde dehydrogenase family protein, partial [Actinomycetales bacterium]